MSVIALGGINVESLRQTELISLLAGRMENNTKTALVFANANLVVQCQGMRDWLNSNRVIVVNDGVAMDIAAKLIHGVRFIENLNGTDFTPALLTGFQSNKRIFLVGGRPGVALSAKEVIEQNFGQAVVGVANGFDELLEPSLFKNIHRSGADIVLVALGNPRQEAWIRDNLDQIDAPLVIGVGALFDFLSGNIPRAPMWVRRIRMEWFFRLLLEPKRLFKRYTIDIVRFIFIVTKQR